VIDHSVIGGANRSPVTTEHLRRWRHQGKQIDHDQALIAPCPGERPQPPESGIVLIGVGF